MNLVNAEGQPLSFFPDDPPASEPGSRRNWVPIFRQLVASTVEEQVAREQFPLTLAWALTHWKAQGMTLDKVRVHLSARTAAVPGIGFVAITRVRHPWDLVFEEDLPDYGDWMRAVRTPQFRMRKRFELRQLAKASHTLRRYGFCEADLWGAEERVAADELLAVLRNKRADQQQRLRGVGRRVDADTWLWRDEGEPDYDAVLGDAVTRCAAGDSARQEILSRVAERLLDRTRLRKATAGEEAMVERLVHACAFSAGAGSAPPSQAELAGVVRRLASEDGIAEVRYREVASAWLARLRRGGSWDGGVDEAVPLDVEQLHMPAVKEALGALIPEGLHGSLDVAVSRGKDVRGDVRGGGVLKMEEWKINVRSEDALASGRLQEEVLEFFLLVLRRLCDELQLPMFVASKTVGKAIGRAVAASELCSTVRKWERVWPVGIVRFKEDLLLTG